MVCVPQPHSLWTYNALHSQPANQIHSLTENESHWLHACALLSTLAKQKSSSSNIHCVNWPHITLLASKQTLLFSTTKSPCFYIKSKEASEMSHANCWHSALCHIATKMLIETCFVDVWGDCSHMCFVGNSAHKTPILTVFKSEKGDIKQTRYLFAHYAMRVTWIQTLLVQENVHSDSRHGGGDSRKMAGQ